MQLWVPIIECYYLTSCGISFSYNNSQELWVACMSLAGMQGGRYAETISEWTLFRSFKVFHRSSLE